jgi:hypothetical protein
VVPRRKITRKLPRRGSISERGKDEKITSTAHRYKDPRNYCKHRNIYVHTKEKWWKLHLEMNPKNWKKGAKKKNLLTIDSSN